MQLSGSFGFRSILLLFLVRRSATIQNDIDERSLSFSQTDDQTEHKNTDFQEMLIKFDKRLHQRHTSRINKYSNLSLSLDSLDHKIIPCLLSQDPVPVNRFKLDILYFNIDPDKDHTVLNRLIPHHVFSNNYSLKDLSHAKIDLSLPTKIITHGFNDGWPGYDNWLKVIADINIARTKKKSNLFFFVWKAPASIQQFNYFSRYGKVVNNVKALGYYLGEFVINLSRVSSSGRLYNNSRFDSIEMMGHSLGAHILGLSARYIVLASGDKIGRLISLDPAYPCFSTMKDTIDKDDVKLLVTTHTNAGLEGMDTKDSDIDIFVNGGTLQPGCKYDATCSHGLARLLYNHVDEECQMVAYRCKSYDQFKFGACEVCNNFIGQRFLVNSQEQTGQEANMTIGKSSSIGRNYFVDTREAYFSNRSLCLQHYQIRLLIGNNNDESGMKKCPQASRQFTRRPVVVYLNTEGWEQAISVQLNPIIVGQLYTGLLTFPGSAKRFSFGLMPILRPLKNFDQNCFIVADVAFMSHTQEIYRDRYSSLLVYKSLPPLVDRDRIISLTEVKPKDFMSITGNLDTCTPIGSLIDGKITNNSGSFSKRLFEPSLLSKVISFLLFIVPH